MSAHISHMFDSKKTSKSHNLANKKHGDGFEAPRNSLDISTNPSKGHHYVTQDVLYPFQVKQHSSKMNNGLNGTPMKKENDEVSRRTSESQIAPSVVARLMGMDTVPERSLNVHAKEHEVDSSRRSTELSEPPRISSVLENSRSYTSSRQTKQSFLLNSNGRDPKTQRTRKPQPRKHPQEELLQKFKKEFEEWQASKLWEHPRQQKYQIIGEGMDYQTLAQEHLNKEKMAKYLDTKKNMVEKKPTDAETKDIVTAKRVVDMQGGPTSLRSYRHLDKQCSSFLNNSNSPIKLETKAVDNECLQDTKFYRKQERSSSPTRIVILKPNFDSLDGYEESLSATSDKLRKECSMEDFLEEVKARLRNEVLGKNGSNIKNRGSGTRNSFSERPIDPKQIARDIAKQIRESVTKDMGTTLMRSNSTRSIWSEIQVNAPDSPEFIRRDTRKFLSDKMKNVLKGEIVVEKHLINNGDSGASSLIKVPKFMSDVSNKAKNVEYWKDKKSVPESIPRHTQKAASLDAESVSQINLMRSFSAPVTGTAFGKLLLEDQHITGAQIRRKHEASEYNFSEVRKHRKDSFNLKGTVSNLKHNLSLKGKLFGKKTRLIKEPTASEFNAVKELTTAPSIVTNSGIAQENSTEVPPSPASVSSSSDEFCRHDNPSPISPLEVIEYHTSPCISEELSSNAAGREPRQPERFEHVGQEITVEEQPHEHEAVQMESKDEAYLRDILVTAGFYEDTDRANLKLDALTRPISHHVFEEVEEAYGDGKVDTESSFVHNCNTTIGHKLLFDLVNEALKNILGPKINCSMFKRWILGPAASPQGKSILDDLWNQIQLHLHPSLDESSTLDSMVVHDLKITWPSILYEDMDIVGRQIERIILHNLLNEMARDMCLGIPR